MRKAKIEIEGMTCASCASHVEKELVKLGAKNISVNAVAKKAFLETDASEGELMNAVKEAGYKPIRVMFYYPQREQAIKIQETLKTIYSGVNGEYYSEDAAWDYLQKTSGYNLKEILTEIAERRDREDNGDK